ncbi:unnamed protein product [Brachionus calyciflorus]|uniref:HAT C-terminal dimerisation domain-containing protein n=1 Tax=Brachionus calyciflorus TaxID=104777 RepID=A0A814RQ81_9BILA|nr:unnamed protein product [Brachionus calyciflorus]
MPRNQRQYCFKKARDYLIKLFSSKRFDDLIAKTKKEFTRKNDLQKKKLNFEDSEESSNEDDSSLDIRAELNVYKKDKSSSDVLEYWRFNRNKFPILSSVASILLEVPATSVPSERFFSHAGYMLWDRRNRLSKINFERIMFLYENKELFNEK